MDKRQAQELVSNTLQNDFDKDRFIYFVKNLLNHIDESKIFHARGYVKKKFKKTTPIVKTYERIGTYTDPEGKKVDVLIVYLEKNNSLDRARTTLRNFVADYLKQRDQKDVGLVAFVSPDTEDWRFSFVKMDYKIDSTKGKVEEEFTPARRYSFLVGKHENSHTAQSCLLPLLLNDEVNPTLKELEDVFSVEKVTKEFFEKYHGLFLKLKKSLDEVIKINEKVKADFKTKNINTVDFAKKLLGQIVFLYFLQKKGWFGVKRDEDWGTGPKNFLRELFNEKHGKYINFFNDIMEPLFYQALRNDRRHDDDYYDKLKCKIPFLNGGLFDPINDYDWVHTDILLANELFSNSEKTKEGDTGTGILDIFDRYNFTVKEDEPLEKEVAVDPEMLGKVFENLLEVKDRKSKGTYYTPREIVHYMCQQSLINYLHSELNPEAIIYEKLGEKQFDMLGNKAKKGQLDLTVEHRSNPEIPKEDIEILIQHGESVVENEATVGTTKSYSYKLKESIRQNAKLIDNKLASIKICDPAIGSGAFPVGMMAEIVKARNVLSAYIKDKNRSIYNFKRECIEKSLYGVDIDPGAVEIAKLRLWLSLVVDEDDIKQIKPLPNLDYKIVCGNSLLSVSKNLFNNKQFIELERLKPLLFNETDPTKKQEYKKQIDKLISQITNGHKDFDFEIYFSEIFHDLPVEASAQVGKKGFDVVIANPPYIRIHKQEQSKIIKEFIKRTYTSAYKDFDYYVLFIERGLNILRKDGILTFITPDKYLVREYGSKIRGLILQYSIVELFDLSRATDIFDAATYPLISIIQKNSNSDVVTIKIARTIQNLSSQYKKVAIPKQRCIDNDRIEIIEPEANKLLTKIFTQSSKLSDILESDQLFCGTPRAKDYHSWAKYVSDSKKSSGCLRVLVCSNIQPYVIRHKKKVRTVGLSVFAPYFCNTSRIISKTRWDDFTFTPKILIRGTDTRITAALDQEGSVFIGVYGIKVYGGIADVYKYLLASLNSQLYQWIFSAQNPSIKIGGEFFSINSPHILRLPFKKIRQGQKELFDELVDKILANTKDDNYLDNFSKQAEVREYEKQIDQLVYKLYGLTQEEIKIVEKD
ncbi:MAG: N-6 DNA methylase [Candidatus Doudnabacteria bacterium]